MYIFYFSLDILHAVCYIKYIVKEVIKLKKKKKDNDLIFKIFELVIQAVIAVAALITALKS